MQVTRPTSEAKADVEAESDTGSLPDWLINPEGYEPSASHHRRSHSC